MFTNSLFLLGTLLATITLTTIYRIYTSPISKLPGSQSSKFTSFTWWYALVRARRVSTQYNAHTKYGQVVRLAPNEVGIADPAAIRTIFAYNSGFLKSDFYPRFTSTRDGDTVFSTITPALHQQRRRLLGNSMSESHLRTLEPHIRRLVDLTIDRMAEQQKEEGRFDLVRWLFYMTTDVIGDLTFGDSFRMLEQRRDNQYITELKSSARVGAIFASIPALNKFYRYLPLPAVRKLLSSQDGTMRSAATSIARYRSAMEKDPSAVHDTLFSKIWREEEAGNITEQQLAFEARAYLVAGTDTTSYSLTYLIWELTRHPDWQDKLCAELATVPDTFAAKDLAHLPLLHQTIQETLRLHAPVMMSLPRVVPDSGLHAGGYFIPPRTVVHPQSYTLSRDSTIYPEPLAFKPQRWAAPTKAMHDNFLGFGAGSRVCLGKNLAIIEMNLAVAAMFKRFPRGFKQVDVPQDMEHSEHFLAGPRGGKCFVTAA